MSKSQLPQLEDALRTRRFIRFDRKFEDSSIRGYVLDIGPRFFLLALVSDRLWFDGFECFRIRDVRNVRPDPYGDFAEAALRLRGEKKPRKPPISLASIQELLLTAGRQFPLVTIHREEMDPEVCWIGHVLSVDDRHVSLLGITPSAQWDQEPESFRLSEITHVNFGADYEDALHLVGGDPPAGWSAST